ncbi:MAG: hypothetical protein RLP09_04235 [Sandaracinaceae bacterium]
MTKTVLSWSSGKDSAWALHVLRQDPSVEVIGLLTTLNRDADRVAMHGVRRALLERQAEAAGLPVDVVELPYPCSNEDYEAAMTGAVDRAKAAGAEVFAFGDLFLEDIRAYREAQLAGTGLGAVFPLWGQDTRALAEAMIDAGLEAIVTCVDPKQLDPSFAGRRFDRALLRDLPAHVDPCGENGELHTLVIAGPMLERPIACTVGEVVERDGFVYADVVPA